MTDLKKKTISQLKKQADKLCSEYIRRKYADWKGEVACYTCGKKKSWKEMQCGHYISRVYTATRWLEENLRVQCYSCNVMKKGNMDEFAIRLERETRGVLERLNIIKNTPVSTLKHLDLIELIKELKEKLSTCISKDNNL